MLVALVQLHIHAVVTAAVASSIQHLRLDPDFLHSQKKKLSWEKLDGKNSIVNKIFWLIGVAFLHTWSFLHTSQILTSSPKKGKQGNCFHERVVKFKIANCCWFLHAKLSIRFAGKKEVWPGGKIYLRKIKDETTSHNGISYMWKEASLTVVTCCYWHVVGQKNSKLDRPRKS